MMFELKKKNELLSESNPENFEQKNPSEIQKSILSYIKYTETLKCLYDVTDSLSSEINIKDLDEIINNAGKQDKKLKEKRNEYEDKFLKYKADIVKIEQNGRKKTSAIKRFAFHLQTFKKEKDLMAGVKTQNYEVGKEYVETRPYIPYPIIETFRNCLDDENKVQFLVIIYRLNENIENLKQIRDRKIAESMQSSDVNHQEKDHVYSYDDRNSFISAGNIDKVISDTEKNAAKSGNKDEKKLSELKTIKAEEDLAAKFDASEVGKVLNQRIVLAYLSFNPGKYSEEIKNALLSSNAMESVKSKSNTRAAAERVSGIRNSVQAQQSGGVPVPPPPLIINPSQQTSLSSNQFSSNNNVKDPSFRMSDKDEYTKVSFVKDIINDNKEDIPGIVGDLTETFFTTVIPFFTKKGIFKDMDESESLLEAMDTKLSGDDITKKDFSFGMTEDQLSEAKNTKLNRNSDEKLSMSKKSDGKTSNKMVSQKSLSNKFAADGAIGTLKSICGVVGQVFKWLKIVDINQEIKHYKEAGMLDDARIKNYEMIASVINNLIDVTNVLKDFAKSGVDIATAAGGLTLGGAQIASTIFTAVGGGLSAASGFVNTLFSMAEYNKAERSKNAANEGLKQLDDLKKANNNVDIRQGSRMLERVKISASKNKAEASLNMATGAAQIASGIFSAVPGGALVGTALGLAASAASFVGKLAISHYFKGKMVDKTWEGVLGIDEASYKKLKKDLGEKSSERFHNILRRKTGIPTRQDYADALAVTDSVDLFAAAKAYPIINASNLDNPESDDQKIIKETLSGMQISDPKKYGNVTLEYIMNKTGANKDWRGTLKHAITNNARFNIKEGIDDSKSRDIINGKYDKRKAVK